MDIGVILFNCLKYKFARLWSILWIANEGYSYNPKKMKNIGDIFSNNDFEKFKIEGIRYALENQIRWQMYVDKRQVTMLAISGATIIGILSFAKDIFIIQQAEIPSYLCPPLLKIILTFVLVTSLCASCVNIFSLFYRNNFRNEIIKNSLFISQKTGFLIDWRTIADGFEGCHNKKKRSVQSNKEKCYGKKIDEIIKNAKNYNFDTQVKDMVFQQIRGSVLVKKKYKFFDLSCIFYLIGILAVVMYILAILGNWIFSLARLVFSV